MQPRRRLTDELVVAQALIYFVFFGVGTVAVALAAHMH